MLGIAFYLCILVGVAVTGTECGTLRTILVQTILPGRTITHRGVAFIMVAALTSVLFSSFRLLMFLASKASVRVFSFVFRVKWLLSIRGALQTQLEASIKETWRLSGVTSTRSIYRRSLPRARNRLTNRSFVGVSILPAVGL